MHYEFSKARLVSRLKLLREYCFFDLCTRCVATHCPPPLRSICSSRDIILMILSIALLFVIFDFFIVKHFNHSSFSKKHAIFYTLSKRPIMDVVQYHDFHNSKFTLLQIYKKTTPNKCFISKKYTLI